MEIDELVTKLSKHIDETAAKTKNEMVVLMEQQKGDIIREVNVLMENQRQQFNTFGEGLQGLNDRMDKMEPMMDGLVEDMDTIKPMIKNINNRLIETEIILKKVK
jgi:hypothetical protein